MSKEEARIALQARLNAMPASEYQALSKNAYKNVSMLLQKLVGRSSPRVLLYHANPAWREVSLDGLADEYPNCTFEYVMLSRDAPLPQGVFAIICVPLYGYTADGYRLGQGAGWYDQLLRQQSNAVAVGVGTKYGLVDFPVSPHDIPMDIIVTDEAVRSLDGIDLQSK